MIKMRRWVYLLLFGMIGAGLMIGIEAQPAGSNRLLFGEAITSQSDSRPALLGTERTRMATIQREALRLSDESRHLGRVIDDPGIVLNLFEDVTYTAVNTMIARRDLGRSGYVWYGTLRGVAYSNMVMIIGDDGLHNIRILLPGKIYYVDLIGGEAYRISELITDGVRQEGLPDYAEVNVTQPMMIGPRSDDGSLIDVMVVYTPAAVAMLGSVANLEIAIEGAIALTNLSFQNSLITPRLRLVHMAQVNYTERPETGTDLDELTNLDGQMDEIHVWRDTYRADLVALVPGTPVAQRNYCGIAWLPNQPDPDFGFSITEALCIVDITFAHEVGHNMGSAHDRANGGTGRTTYAYGYQDPANPIGSDWADFVTIMAYSSHPQNTHCPQRYQPGVCPAILWWSNPNQTFNGSPLGINDALPNGTNNTRSLNEAALAVANYRISLDGGTTPTETPVITPTNTPYLIGTATPTPLPGGDLLLNGGFEIDADLDAIPDGWNLRGRTQRVCNTIDQVITPYGMCSLILRGGTTPGINTRASQTIATLRPQAGQTINLSAQINAQNIATGASLMLTVTYLNPITPISTLTLPLNVGTYEANGSLTLNGQVARLRLTVEYRGATGRIYVDEVRVRWLP
jgi:hypothetical protein